MQHEVADYVAYAGEHAIGMTVRGRVLAVRAFGVFVELAANVHGLLEVLNFAGEAPKRYPEDYPRVGDEVEAAIVWMDAAEMNIRLTQRPAGGAA